MVVAPPQNFTVVEGFHALSDPLRLQIIKLLQGQELCVCDLCDQIGVSQSKLSFHIKVLREAGLIQWRQQGRWTYYCLNLEQFVLLEQFLREITTNSVNLPAKGCISP